MSGISKIFYYFKNKLSSKKVLKRHRKIIKKTCQYYAQSTDKEIISVLNYYKTKKTSVFPYKYFDEILARKTNVFFDENYKLPFVIHNQKPLYFPKELEIQRIAKLYNWLCYEQDSSSPHSYVSDNFALDEGSILIDIGCAEGIFTLSNIEQINHAFLFESEDIWIEPLKATFHDWTDKVTITKALVSSQSKNDQVSIDDFLAEKTIANSIFIKIDVEGHEEDVLTGAKNLLANPNMKIKTAIATYHRHEQFDSILKIMTDLNYTSEPSKGYILFYYDNDMRPPYLRKCLLYSKNYIENNCSMLI